ncbi:hypothetical protein GCM10020254_71550 [Streptomyces goshikiensis]
MLRRITIGAAVAVLSAVALPAQAETAYNPPGRITVDVVGVNGSGCPQGTASVATASDNTAFTVTYSDYLAQAGAGSGGTEFRKNCQLALQVHVPQGFTYAIARADYRGFAHLQRGAFGQGARQLLLPGDGSVGPRQPPVHRPVHRQLAGERPDGVRGPGLGPPVARSATSTSTPNSASTRGPRTRRP